VEFPIIWLANFQVGSSEWLGFVLNYWEGYVLVLKLWQ